MKTSIPTVLAKNPKRLFLLDGLGALLSIVFLSGILSPLESWFGMPTRVLFFLSLVAAVYGIYSIACAFLITKSWAPFIQVIVIANALYCFLTVGLVIHFYHQLTVWGIIYFILEIALIFILACIEQKTIRRINSFMSFSSEAIKQTSRDFRRHFDFLVNQWGFKMTMESFPSNSSDNYIRTYRNQYVQVEIAGNQSYFHAEIRRLINGELRPYYDEGNNISHSDLFVLLNNKVDDEMHFYPASAGWIQVLENTAQVFKQSKTVFTSGAWLDIQRIEQIREDDFFSKFGFRPSENKHKPTFFELVRKHAFKLLDKGFQLRIDSTELPPYDADRLTQKIILEKGNITIKISQADWRDNYYTFYLHINGDLKFEIDLNKYHGIETAAAVFNEQLDKNTGTMTI